MFTLMPNDSKTPDVGIFQALPDEKTLNLGILAAEKEDLP